MKNAIKVLCFTLAVLLVGTASVMIYLKWDKSDFNYVDGTEKGTVMITEYTGESKEVKIPSTLRGKKVTRIDDLAFENSDITSVEIGDNVTYIGLSAFRDCKSLKKAVLGKNILNIDEGCFDGCASLEEITLPKSLEKLGGAVFAACTSLKKVELEDGGNFAIKDDILFSSDYKTLYCALPYAKITDYTCPDSVETLMPFAFYNCVTLTNFNFSKNIKAVPQATFIGCKNLKELVLPDTVTQIGAAVTTLSGIKKITIPSSVTTINDSAFVNSDGEIDSDIIIRTTSGSRADSYAQSKSIKVEYIK